MTQLKLQAQQTTDVQIKINIFMAEFSIVCS